MQRLLEKRKAKLLVGVIVRPVRRAVIVKSRKKITIKNKITTFLNNF